MAKTIVMVLGVVFVLIGILGFFNDPILGIFDVNALHNVIHLASGLVALAMARTEAGAVTFAKVFGVVYALVAILGFVAGGFMDSLLDVNAADNWLHVVLALVFLWVGFGNKSTANMSNGMNS